MANSPIYLSTHHNPSLHNREMVVVNKLPQGSVKLMAMRFAMNTNSCLSKLAVISLLASLMYSTAWAESLPAALTQALQSNPQLEAARSSLAALENEVNIARGGYLPTLSADAIATYNEYKNDGTKIGQLGLQLDQALYDGLATRSAINSAQALLLSAKAQVSLTTQQVLLDSVTSYADVLRDVELIQIRESNFSFLSNQIALVKQRLALGSATKTELSQANAQQAEAVARLAAANAQLESSRAAYRQVVGDSPGTLAPAPVPAALLPKTLATALDLSNVDHPLLEQATETAKSAQFDIELARSGLRPTVGLSARLERIQNDLPINDQRHLDGTNASVSIQLRVPIYQAGQATARVKQSRDVLKQRQQQIQILDRQVRATIETAWHQLVAARAVGVASNAQLDAARFARDGKLDERSVGLVSTQDVLLAQQEVLEAEVAISQSKRDEVVAAYSLLYAMGQLNMSNLELVSES